MSAEIVISITALVLSLISMSSTVVFSFLQTKHNKKSIDLQKEHYDNQTEHSKKIFELHETHNKISVKPICTIELTAYDNLISIYIENVGTGAVEEISEIKITDRHGGVYDYLFPILPKDFFEQQSSVHCFGWKIKGHPIPVGGKLYLLKIVPVTDELSVEIKDILKYVTISIKYNDVYGNTFHQERKLDMFGLRKLYDVKINKSDTEVH